MAAAIIDEYSTEGDSEDDISDEGSVKDHHAQDFLVESAMWFNTTTGV